ncbi:MAG: ribonuclease R [Porphyromonadaceae bacterium]|nr:ribonuclease R [Porphyromonadaceae bacterium]
MTKIDSKVRDKRISKAKDSSKSVASKARKTSKKNSLAKGVRGLTNENIETSVRALFQAEPSKVFNYKQVCSIFGQTTMAQKRQVVSVLEALAVFGFIEELELGRYRLASSEKPLEGMYSYKGGHGTFIPDDGSEPRPLSDRASGRALHGDRVRLHQVRIKGRRGGYSLEVAEVLERSTQTYVGRLTISRGNAFFVSESRELRQDIFIPSSELNGAKHGQLVVVRPIGWDKRSKNPHGMVVDVLGAVGDNNAEMHAILAEFGLPYDYPVEVEQAALALSEDISAEELVQREDYRGVTTFTIDPKDAKDFDDALSVRQLSNGNIEVGVHIADVSYFVRPGSIIDAEAYKRATSIYLVDRTIPMLPERLSNFLCSLRPDEDKYAYSCILELNAEAEVVNYRIARCVIRSNRRYTYEEAQDIIKGAVDEFASEVLLLNTLAQKLRVRRFEAGSISFERPEVRFDINEMGKPLSVYIKESLEAHQLIEEFMLLANRIVAQTIGSARERGKARPFVYRVHDQPDPERLETLATFAAGLGYKVKTQGSGRVITESLNKLLANVKGKPEDNLLSTVAIRTMAKAKYTTDNIGHYGLAFDYYTHFTSPIRRYPDLMVHRLLTRYLFDRKGSARKDELEEQCEHSSAMEQLAAQAERASIRYKQVEYLSAFLGHEFDGVISGLTDWGIYVELLENKCEGMIPIRDLDADYYEYDEKNFVLIGRRYGKRYRLADPIRVVVAQANLERKQIDFKIVEE